MNQKKTALRKIENLKLVSDMLLFNRNTFSKNIFTLIYMRNTSLRIECCYGNNFKIQLKLLSCKLLRRLYFIFYVNLKLDCIYRICPKRK